MEPEARAEPVATAEDGALRRAARAVEVLVSAHVTLARVEASADAARIFDGLVMLASALGLLAIATLLAHAALVVIVHAALGGGWAAAIGALALGDALLAAVLLAIARARLKTPVLVQTRARLAEATTTLRRERREPLSP